MNRFFKYDGTAVGCDEAAVHLFSQVSDGLAKLGTDRVSFIFNFFDELRRLAPVR